MNRIMLSHNTYRCRLCLKVSTEVINIFREDFPKMIKLLTSIQVTQTDDLPKVACISCARRVKASMIIRKQIIKAHRTLMEERLAKKNSSVSNPSSSEKSSQILLDKRNTQKEAGDLSSEIIIVDDDSDVEQVEKSILINSPNSGSKIPANKDISAETSEKKIQNLSVSLNKKEISIVRISTQKDTKNTSTRPPALINNVRVQLRRGLKPQPSTTTSLIRGKNTQVIRSNPQPSTTTLIRGKNIQVVRSNPRMNFRPAIKVESLTRRGPKPKQTDARYEPLTPIPCKICQKKIQKTNMKKHLEIHDKKIVTCHLCGKVTNNTALRSHIFYFHKCKEDEYVCDQCGRHFRYRSKFKLHMKKQHGGTKDFECTICGRKFFERKYLTKHIDCHHKKIRLFICDHCGKDFSTKHALKVHLRQHTEIAPYGCDTCGLKFRQNVSLKTHRKHAHDICEEETVFCEVCGKGFASTVALTSHFRLHERKKCSHCAEIFVRVDYLERHIKDQHGETKLNSENDETPHEAIELNSEKNETPEGATNLKSENDETSHEETELMPGNDESSHEETELMLENDETLHETAELNSENDETTHEESELKSEYDEISHEAAEINFEDDQTLHGETNLNCENDETNAVQVKTLNEDFLHSIDDMLT